MDYDDDSDGDGDGNGNGDDEGNGDGDARTSKSAYVVERRAKLSKKWLLSKSNPFFTNSLRSGCQLLLVPQ